MRSKTIYAIMRATMRRRHHRQSSSRNSRANPPSGSSNDDVRRPKGAAPLTHWHGPRRTPFHAARLRRVGHVLNFALRQTTPQFGVQADGPHACHFSSSPVCASRRMQPLHPPHPPACAAPRSTTSPSCASRGMQPLHAPHPLACPAPRPHVEESQPRKFSDQPHQSRNERKDRSHSIPAMVIAAVAGTRAGFQLTRSPITTPMAQAAHTDWKNTNV